MDSIIVAKSAIALVGVVVAWAAASSSWMLSLSKRDFDRLLYAAAIGSRLGLFALAYLVLGFTAQSDAAAYHSVARMVLAGGVPGESEALPLHYGPLFLHLAALPLLAIDSGKTIVAARCSPSWRRPRSGWPSPAWHSARRRPAERWSFTSPRRWHS